MHGPHLDNPRVVVTSAGKCLDVATAVITTEVDQHCLKSHCCPLSWISSLMSRQVL